MPIILEDLDLDVAASLDPAAVTPKFFSSKLTGAGKKTGLLNEALLPVNTVTSAAYLPHPSIEVRANHTENGVTSSVIPFAPLTRRAVSVTGRRITLPVPPTGTRFRVDPGPAVSSTWEVYLDMTPQGSVLYEERVDETPVRSFVIQYRIELYFLKAGFSAERAVLVDANQGPGNFDAAVVVEWDTSPLTGALGWVNHVLAGAGGSVSNADELDEWLREYDIHAAVTRQAEIWNGEEIAEEICAYVEDAAGTTDRDHLNAIAQLMRYLENYNVPLDAYRTIHKAIEACFPADVAGELSKQNLNLLMNHTLDQLDRIRPTLAAPVVPTVPGCAPVLPAHLSAQQREAVSTTEPLVMTQAGAGTGKSTVILDRIGFLTQCGVDPAEITVLSFTNAAADNITDRNPDVGSMTIARMIHDIYALNHPTHELSSVDTIINSIDIFYPNNSFAATLRGLLLKVAKKDAHASTALNTFLENNFDAVIALLDRIKQTSLELEIVICYQRIDTMVEPAHVACRYLIIDEVQDNSIFEFIYLLKHVTKNAQSLYMVGDASQTLYEWRFANPRALNTLESSGVFATYKLSTNYRSNQEILDFANIVLGGLETNRFAEIQLRANDLTVPTADSFQEKVTLDYRAFPRLREFEEDLPQILANTVVPDYVRGCIDRGEQVAFLAYTRRAALTAQQVFEQAFPGKHIANLTSEKTYATDVFSQFIKHCWNDVLQVPPASAPFAIDQGIVNNLDKLTRNAAKAAPAIINMVREWWVRNQPVVQAWLSLHAAGGMSEAEFFEQLRDNLLGYEISHNAVRQSLMNQKNRERKQRNAEAKADLVVSTIHGAKGMEFDNVVVLHKEDTTMAQDMRRLYYVAFTRAMKSMHVLSYGTVAKAPIQANYDTLVTLLEQRDAANAARSADAADLDRETPDPLDRDASPQPSTSAPRLAVGATPDDPYDPLEPDVMAHAS